MTRYGSYALVVILLMIFIKAESAAQNITLNPEPAGTVNSFWMPTVLFGPSYGLTVERRNAWIDACVAEGVEARPFFYPVSGMPMYTDVQQNTVSRELSASGINLPSNYELTPDDIAYVVGKLARVTKG